jgi:uncharacterized membrane protein
MQDNNINKPQPRYSTTKASKYDNALLGFFTAFTCILIAIITIKFLRHDHLSLGEYLKYFITLDNPYIMSEAAKILSLSMIILLAPFYFFLNKKAYLSTKGVIILAVIIAVTIMCYKFIW